MSRRLSSSLGAASVGFATLSIALPATAQRVTEGGHTAVVVDHVTGFFHDGARHPDAPGSLGDDSGLATYGGPPASVTIVGVPTTRVGVHHFFSEALSIGGSLHWSTLSVSGYDVETFGIAPRVGYAIPIGETSALWLRAGVDWYHFSYGSAGSAHTVMLGGEASLVAPIATHVAILFGPMIDWSIEGSATQKTGARSIEGAERRRLVGLTLGFLFDL